jgi:type IX secretion system substrate protein
MKKSTFFLTRISNYNNILSEKFKFMKNFQFSLSILTWVLISTFVLNTDLTAQTLNDNGSTHTINHNGSIRTTGSAQDYTIPSNSAFNSISFTLRGGDGGYARASSSCKSNGGEGATTTAKFWIGTGTNELLPGGTIRFIVGKHGENGSVGGTNSTAGGGGGGTAVLYRPSPSSSWIILAAAGGGGGAFQGHFGGCVDSQKGKGAQDTENGSSGEGNVGGSGGTNGGAGGDGNVSGPCNATGDGGGGAYGGGSQEGFPDGGTGASGDIQGGFGFGGGGSGGETGCGGGGGGGGYSGGGGGADADNGGGGGSYVNSTYAISSSKTAGSKGGGNSVEGHVDYTFENTFISWTGAVDGDWHNSGNWSPNIVPRINSIVYIYSAANAAEIFWGGTGVAKEIRVYTGSLTISGILNVHPLNSNGITNYGTIINNSPVNSGGSLGGEINITRYNGNSNSIGIENLGGTFTNMWFSTINIDDIDGHGILNASNGSFTNQFGGTINIGTASNSIGENGILNESGCTFINSGTLKVRNTATLKNGIENRGSFTNSPNANMYIDQTGRWGFIQFPGATFNNSGTITIGSLATINADGLQNQGAFTNNASGTIIIDQVTRHGIYNYRGTFTNKGLVKIGENGGIANRAIHNSDGNNGYNPIFLNNGCDALIHIFDKHIEDPQNGFTNNATILQESTGSSNIHSNNGVILYNAGSFTVDNGNTPLSVSGSFSGKKIWIGCTDNDWHTADNWYPYGVPSLSDEVSIYPMNNFPTISNTANARVVRVFNVVSGNGVLTLDAGSILNLHPVSTEGIYNAGIILSSGEINITRYNGNSNLTGIDNEDGDFYNQVGSVINIDGMDDYGIRNRSGSSFTNQGTVNIGTASNQIGDHGILNESGCSINNHGTINVRNIDGNGISNEGTFENQANGNIQIDQTTVAGIVHLTGTFNNWGTMTIGSISAASANGISSNATFNNQSGASISIVQAALGIANNNGTFTNTGLIEIGENGNISGGKAIQNGAVFLNSSCSAIIHLFDGRIQDGGNSFTNSGIILQESIGGSYIHSNNGVILYNTGSFTVDNGNAPVSVSGSFSGKKVWMGCTDNDWDTDSNWYPNGVPTLSNEVIISQVTNSANISGTTNAGVVRVFSSGVLTLQAGSILNLYPVSTEGIYNAGTIVSGGEINITRYNGNANLTGIDNEGGAFYTQLGGVINIDGMDGYGIHNRSGGYILNDVGVSINIGTASSQIGDHGILNEPSGSINNYGTINVRNISGHGFSNEGTFENQANGNIQIDQTTGAGILHLTGTLNNWGTMTIGSISAASTNGISSNATFNNQSGASISIVEAALGIANNNGTFTNTGLIEIGENGNISGGKAIQNGATAVFLNSSCSAIIHLFDGRILDSGDSFTNSGTILQESTGSSNIHSNNGVILYNTGNFTVDTGNAPVSVSGSFSGKKIWTACTDSDWDTADNWIPSGVPTSTDEVVIYSSTANPIIANGTTVQCQSLTLESGATLTNSGSLTVAAGDFEIKSGATGTGNGTYFLNGDFLLDGGGTFAPGTSTVTMTKSGGYSVIDLDGSFNFHNLVIDIVNTSYSVIFQGFGTVTITNELNMLSGNLDLNGNVIELTDNGTITGESAASYILSSDVGGFVKKTVDLNAPTSENPGNIGVSITSSANLGSTTIQRGYEVQDVNGEVSIVRYYDISPANNSGLDATVRFSYFDHELNGNVENDLIPFRYNGTTWDDYPVTANDVTANWVETNGVDAFSIWTLANSSSILPVELIHFSAVKNADEVLLRWQTATELNNEGFEVEHSTDGRNWDYLGFVMGNGTSIQQHDYNFTHKSPANGVNYYRLLQVDFDGQSEYSDIRTVTFDDWDRAVKVFPNPATTDANIQLPAEYQQALLLVSDLSGRTVFEQRLESGSPNYTLDVTSWQSGMYLVQVLLDGRVTTTHKLQVIKD